MTPREPAPRPRRRRFTRLVLVVALALPATQCLRQDEVECEEAVAHLADCCDDFDRSAVDCQYSDYCGTSYPDLRPGESQCILDRSCDDIRKGDLCERVMSRPRNSTDDLIDWDASYPVGEVCP